MNELHSLPDTPHRIDGVPDPAQALMHEALIARFGSLIGELRGAGETILAESRHPFVGDDLRRTTHQMLLRTVAELARDGAVAVAADARVPDASTSRAVKLWQRSNTGMRALVTAASRDWARRHVRTWPAVGFGLSWAGAACIVVATAMGPFQLWFAIATVFVILRVVGAAAVGPADDWLAYRGPTVRHCTNVRHWLLACVLSHTNDVILGAAVAGVLLTASRTAWALLTLCGVMIGILGSLARIAAERDGWDLQRSIVERVVRVGPVLIAFPATAIVGSGALHDGPPLIALTGLGCAAFGCLELVRVWQKTDQAPTILESMHIVVERDGHVRCDALTTREVQRATVIPFPSPADDRRARPVDTRSA